ncbi:MAG TPA: response regulator transcription factor [Acidimicrobiales bacterium]|nr:response regulator transcription factor [Acidimicrobiales bacterium]
MSDERRRALVVEDDVDLARAVAGILGDEGFDVVERHDGETGFEEALAGPFDVIVLDVMLPRRNGFNVCLDLRRAQVQTPLMMLTAKDGQLDEIEGLEVGADDFLRKPFERSIFSARVHALVRRHARGRPAMLVAGPVALDPLSRRVTRRGDEVTLTPREFALLEHLLQNLDRPLAKADILDSVWGPSFDGDPNIVEVYVGYLRRKLDEPGEPSLIATVRGVGYVVRAAP